MTQAGHRNGGDDFSVRFWGVRGSIACSGPCNVRYGGNTSAVEIRCGSQRLLFDAGTGVRYLGDEIKGEAPLDLDIFFSHTHYDHVCGVPFFGPFYDPRNRFRVFAGHLAPALSLREVLCGMMQPPLFPVPLEVFKAELTFHDFAAGETLYPRPGIAVRTAPLNHPNGATGYRIEYAGRSICYLTDTEHVIGRPDGNILGLIQGADIVIYDAMYTDETYPAKVGWGHSTWQEGVRLCDLAGVGRFVAFHHDPEHDDATLDRIAAELTARRPGSVLAREGMVLRP
ncbi:MAG: MBL fold metallo-hydrolase [Alphaproteobacteria bacterium]|nr:MBL fold metallo-hydrolase [Alphaproteobacteria bacterium]